MKTRTKVFLTLLCVLLLVCGTFLATYSYLTQTTSVTNTFTIGKVEITLDESKVDSMGIPLGGRTVDGNEYHLIPNHTYTKDPVLHFKANSEESYIFVTVDNGITAIESDAEGYDNIVTQMNANGWTELKDGDATITKNGLPVYVYAKDGENKVAKANEDQDFPIFEKIMIDGDLNSENLEDYAGAQVTVQGYCIQSDGFNNALEAWNTGFAAA